MKQKSLVTRRCAKPRVDYLPSRPTSRSNVFVILAFKMLHQAIYGSGLHPLRSSLSSARPECSSRTQSWHLF